MTHRTKKKAQAQKVEFQTVQKKALAPFEGLCFYLTFGCYMGMIWEQIKSYYNEQTDISPITVFNEKQLTKSQQKA